MAATPKAGLEDLPREPHWTVLRGEVRRTSWGPDGLVMSALHFVARHGHRHLNAWADPEPGRDYISAPGRSVLLADAAPTAEEADALNGAVALLQPHSALERMTLQIVAQRWVRRRLVRSLAARFREGTGTLVAPFGMMAGGDTFLFLVDVRRGAVLQATGYAAGSVIDRVELAGLRFDAPQDRRELAAGR